jgi:hypothetical protein
MSLITDTIITYLPPNTKITPSGWRSFNATCCDDNRSRGGLIINEGGAVSYHCFNCNTKASWQPGRMLSRNMKTFMRSLGIDDTLLTKLSFEALRLHDAESDENPIALIPRFNSRELPPGSEPIINFLDNPPEKLMPVLAYMNSRNLFLEDYNFHWTPQPGFDNRLIIPFYYQDKIVGYTARAINKDKTRYLSEQQPGYVFNLDRQRDDRKYIIVCEGPLDAISIDGCAVLGSEIKENQNWLLKQQWKEIVLVPDRDHEGPKTVAKAIEYGWSVSFPEWPDGVKDVNDAVIKIGRLATLWLIVQAKQTNEFKIKLHATKWFR